MRCQAYLFIAVIYFLAYSTSVDGQTTYTLPEVTPKSPNAAGFEKYVTVPVSLSTGQPNVSIPLYTIDVDGLQIPITLTYHYTGLKVDEIPSWVGLGWDLQAGGMISYQQRGVNDFDPQYGMLIAGSGSLADLKTYLHGAMSTTDQFNYLERIINSREDNEFDLYSMNFLNFNESFYFDTLAVARFLPKSDKKVIKTALGFKILDIAGNQFYFETTEHATRYSASGVEILPTFEDVSAYYVSRIVTKNGRIIRFTYKTYNLQYNRSNTLMGNWTGTLNSGEGCPNSGFESAGTYYSQDYVLADSIIFDLGYIKFLSTASNRQDLIKISANAAIPSLAGLVICDNMGNIIKQFSMVQNYFGSNERLKLSSVQELNGTTTGRRWSFSYLGETASFPDFFSNSKDHWGFYNGKLNTYSIPYGDYDNIIGVGWHDWLSGNYADKTSDFNSSSLGVLDTVRYPTGGYSAFTYEPNQIHVQNANDILSLSPYFQWPVNTSNTNSQTIADANTNLSNGDVSGSFTINQSTVVTVNTFEQLDPTQFDPASIAFGGTSPGAGQLNSIVNMRCSSTQCQGFKSFLLGAGNYTYTIHRGTNYNSSPTSYYQATLSITTLVNAGGGIPAFILGGVRIAQSTNTDIINPNNPIQKKYLYNDSLNHVSFKNIPRYHTDLEIKTGEGYECAISCGRVFTINDEVVMPFSGAVVEYLSVSEWEGVNAQNGRTDYAFMPSVNQGSSGSQPFITPENTSWRSGNVLSSKTYKNSNSVFSAVREIDNSYVMYSNQFQTNGLRVDYSVGCTRGSGETFSTTHRTNLATLFTEQFYQNQASVTEYENNSINRIMNTSEGSSYHTLPTLMENFDSKGQSLRQMVVYSFDYSNFSTAASPDALGIKNISLLNIVSPIEKIKIKTIGGVDYIVEGTVNTYWSDKPVIHKTYTLNISSPLPYSTFLLSKIDGSGNFIMDSHYEERQVLNAYDNYNNLLEVFNTRDKTISYLYDYKQTYPIARVDNASAADVAYTSFEADGTGNWTIGAGTRSSSGGITGNNYYALSSGAFISKSGLSATRKYLVTYWSKTGPLTISGTTAIASVVKRGWTCYQHTLPAGSTSVSISGTGITLDELRLYPTDAQMVTYTYTPLIGQTSTCSPNNGLTYYEYDGLSRLLRIRDMDNNIVKQYDYQYQVGTSCGSTCYILPLQTLAGTNTLSYPVGVFNANGKLLGNALNQSQYLTLWNADTADQHRGTLAAGGDSIHFNFTLTPGKTIPAITGCRYFQMDLPWNQLDGVRNWNAAYVDFGDTTGMRLAANLSDSLTILAPRTTQTQGSQPYFNYYAWYFIHTYPDTSRKTLTFYHNDAAETEDFDNIGTTAISLSKLRNLRGNLPQHTTRFGGSSYQQASMLSVAGIINWNALHSIHYFRLNTGDGGLTTCQHLSYPQDFMAGNPGLDSIMGARNNVACYFDSTFKLSRLKSDWNTYFTQLNWISITDAQWNREDLSALKNLSTFSLIPARQHYSNDPTGNPVVPIPAPNVDMVFTQLAAGAGQALSNGFINIDSGGSGRTLASNTAVTALLAKGWVIYLDGVQLH